ncbi:DNA polymerase III subunit alpha [Clostridium perfringens]|uniref:DNA polymerase III subunit alpha n=1 Tax=Clostridium perfringens TaxID=1502 RepID=UPI0039EA8DB2
MKKILLNNPLDLELLKLNIGGVLDLVKEGEVLLLKHNDLILDSFKIDFSYRNLFDLRNKYKVKIIDEFTVSIIIFSDLHRHSGYSLLDGANTIKSIVEKTEYSGALTDHANMFGTLEYWKKMRNAGKKGIVGVEVYTETIDGKLTSNHLVLLAKNDKGFHNLLKLSSLSWNNFYYKPHVRYDDLEKHCEGLICLTACLGGEIPKAIRNDNIDRAEEVLLKLKSMFDDDLYVEVQKHGIKIEENVNENLIKLANKHNIKIVATTDSHYTEKDDDYIHEILLCMQTGKTINEKHYKFDGSGYHLHSSSDMFELWGDNLEYLINTLEIEDKVEFEFDIGKTYMPKFPVPEGFKDETEYFIHLCWEGFKFRFEGTDKYNSEEYRERLKFEIETINNMGFPGYFLIVWDFINFAKSRGILVGPGRGSACGSLVAYCLRITEIEPIKYGLLFERFLNPSRVSMPDIDVDFEDSRREEVINYVKEKYGEECVSRIITFGTLASKMVLRDVGRVLDLPLTLVDKIAKLVPVEPKMTLNKALEQNVELRDLYESDETVKNLINIAKRLEGLPKNMSEHACGVLIARSSVNDYIPQVIMKDQNTGVSEAVTQYNMAECEEMGVLKMDFLGLRTMGVFSLTIKYINEKRIKEGKKPLTLSDVPINDVNVYKYISQGNTFGVFQLESPGMTSFMEQLFQDVNKNSNGDELFERLIAGISLYRPGPIDEIPNYIKNMLNPNDIVYDMPQLKSILSNTYNVIVYQEQCMFIVRELAGFSKGDADNVRKAFAKKKDEMIDPLGKKFLYGEVDSEGNIITEGCLRRGISEELATQIWEKMRKFGRYAFNKSHATGYADIAIRTAWFAYYYPVEYFTATLNSYLLGKGSASEKITLYLSICKKLKIDILQPDVNLSDRLFSVDGDSIRFGLKGIRDMGKISDSIMEEKKYRGNFNSFQDFVERMAVNYCVNKKVMEALVYSGALDGFEKTRRSKLLAIPLFTKLASSEKKHADQLSLFDLANNIEDENVRENILEIKDINVPDIEEFDSQYKLKKEKEYSGYYITGHPLDKYDKYFKDKNIIECGYLLDNADDEEFDEEGNNIIRLDDKDSMIGEYITIAGIIKEERRKVTKNNDLMSLFKIEDRTGEVSVVAFPKQYSKYQNMIYDGAIVLLKGKVDSNDYGLQIQVQSVVDIKTIALSNTPSKIIVTGSKYLNKSREQFKAIRELINSNEIEKGDTEIFFVNNGIEYKVSDKSVAHSYKLLQKLQYIVNERNVIVKYVS